MLVFHTFHVALCDEFFAGKPEELDSAIQSKFADDLLSEPNECMDKQGRKTGVIDICLTS
jgi:hypothetical protein